MDFKQKAVSGLKWTVLSAAFQSILQILRLGILARYLTAEDFGLMAIVMVVIGFAGSVKDMGLSSAVIQRQDVTSQQLTTLFWLNILTGLVLFILISLFSSTIAQFYGDAQLSSLIIFTASTLFLQSFGNQFSALLQKSLKFKILELLTFAVQVSTFVFLIALLILGYGIWALVFSQIFSTTISAIVFFAYGQRLHKPGFYFNLQEVSELVSFGLYRVGEQLVNNISANLDKLIIGKVLGLDILGIYTLAWQLVRYPLRKINPIINKIAFPLYAKIQDKQEAVIRYYSFSLRVLILIICPLLSFLAFWSLEVIDILYGEGWEQVVVIVQVLAGIGLLKAISNPGGALLLAKGAVKVGFWWNVFWMLLVGFSLSLATIFSRDIVFACFVYLAVNVLGAMIWHSLLMKYAEVRYSSILKTFIPLALFCVAMLFFIRYTAIAFFGETLQIMQLTGGILIFGFSFCAYLYLIEGQLLKQVFDNLIRKK